MAKPWFFQMMGAEIGPLTSAELMERVKLGQVQPDTLVRSGTDGKWIPADRWKGLLPSKEDKRKPPQAPAKESPTAVKTEAKTDSVAKTTTASTIPIEDEDDPIYHLKGEAAPSGPVPFSHPDEYDFFQFVGFRQAISHKLYDQVVAYSHQHQMTLTQITRRAIAQFIGKPELGEDKPAPAPESETAEVATSHETGDTPVETNADAKVE